jgi:PadR family transcriptional regulator, regulatory protein PadR
MSKPMQEPTFLILTALVSEPLHGYALISEVEKASDGRVRLRVGTLYAALDRLTQEGLVEVHAEEVVNGRLRRTYRVTGEGAAALSAEAERMASLARRARTRLGHRGVPATGFEVALGGAR